MKVTFLLLAATLAVVSSEPGIKDGHHQPPPPLINRPKPPSNLRLRRSPEPQGSVVLQRQQYLDGPERRPTWNLDYQHKLYEGKDGYISAAGGGIKLPGRNVEPHFGVQGTWRF